MNVMNAAQDAGFEKLIVAGEPLTKKAQEELRETTERDTEETVKPETPAYNPAESQHPELPARPRVNIPGED